MSTVSCRTPVSGGHPVKESMASSLKDALRTGLSRLKKDIEILVRVPSKDYPVEDLRVTTDMLELLMREIEADVPHNARPSTIALYFVSKEVELGKVQHGNSRDAETKTDVSKS